MDENRKQDASLLPPPDVHRAGGTCSTQYAAASSFLSAFVVPLTITVLAGVVFLARPLAAATGEALGGIPAVAAAAAEAEAEATAGAAPFAVRAIEWLTRISPLLPVLPVMLAFAYITWRMTSRTRYVLTATHIYTARLAWGQKTEVVALDQLTTMEIGRSPIERLFGVWNIQFGTRGKPINIWGVTDPAPLMRAYEAATGRPLRADVLENAEPTPPAAWTARLSGRGLASAIVTHSIAPTILVLGPEALSAMGAGSLGINGILLAVAVSVVSVIALAKLLRSRYEIGGGSVRVENGLLGRHERRMDVARIADIQVTRPPFARLFGCGHLKVVSESGEKLTLYGLRDPEGAQAILESFRPSMGVPA